MLRAIFVFSFLLGSLNSNARILKGDWESTGVPAPMPPTKSFTCRAEVTDHTFVQEKGQLVAYTDFNLNSANDWSLKSEVTALNWKWVWLFFGDETALADKPRNSFDLQSISVDLVNDTKGMILSLSINYNLDKYVIPLSKSFQSRKEPLRGKVYFFARTQAARTGTPTSLKPYEYELFVECVSTP